MSLTSRLLKVACKIPPLSWRVLMALAAEVLATFPTKPVRRWITNSTIATGNAPTRSQLTAAIRSWGRNMFQSIQLGTWSRDQILQTVVVSPQDQEMVAKTFNTTGFIVALPHMGSWDLCGAWACQSGYPVSSVAEELTGEEFQMFLDARSQIGMKIYGLNEKRLVPKLVADAKAGRLVCLVADRDMSRSSIPVTWPTPGGSQNVSLPPGPALVAQLAKMPLLPVYSYYEGDRMVMRFAEPITVAPGAEGVAAATQELADRFSRVVQEHVTDWHMFQRFFGPTRRSRK